MGEAYVREIGRVDQEPGKGIGPIPLTVGIDHDTILIGCPGMTWHLAIERADELVALLITAIMYAEQRAATLAGETSG